ncbi:DUF1707 domain-containing protein [Actinoplanes sp. NPDC051859]|uniref:DUF1707 domain-containing protein n=1 Tax=Actinoplanes sp. NPDC051859 TaxID=3363909 RepID=UPI0037B2E0E1
MHPSDIPGPQRLRTSDAEREQVAEILRAAMAEGRLSLDEGEQRLGAGYAATYRDELAPLTADLPEGGRQALAATPQARKSTRRALRQHAGFVALLAVLLTGLWALSDAEFFWPVFPLAFLVMGLIRHIQHGPGYRGRRHAPWHAVSHR